MLIQMIKQFKDIISTGQPIRKYVFTRESSKENLHVVCMTQLLNAITYHISIHVDNYWKHMNGKRWMERDSIMNRVFVVFFCWFILNHNFEYYKHVWVETFSHAWASGRVQIQGPDYTKPNWLVYEHDLCASNVGLIGAKFD